MGYRTYIFRNKRCDESKLTMWTFDVDSHYNFGLIKEEK